MILIYNLISYTSFKQGIGFQNPLTIGFKMYILLKLAFNASVETCLAAQAQTVWDIAQYNKFVESGSKNQTLINQTTASMSLEDDQAKTRGTDVNEFTVRGGQFPYKSSKPITSIIVIATMFFFYFSDPFLMEGLLYYIVPFGPS